MNWYYLNEAGEVVGPFSRTTLEEMVNAGMINRETRFCREGSEEWVSYDSGPGSAASQAARMPLPVPAAAQASSGAALLDEAKKSFSMIPEFLKRSFSTAFHGEMATADESKQLAGTTSDPTLCNFLTWRRAVLAVGVLLLFVSFICGLPGFFQGLDEYGDSGFGPGGRTPSFIHFTNIVLQISVALAIYLFARAHLNWAQYRSSRKQAYIAACALFFVPFILYMMPVRWFLSDDLDGLGEVMPMVAFMGLAYALLLIPTVLSVFPAFLRSSLVMKSAVPESTLPGWIALVVAPFNMLFFLIGLVVMLQIGYKPGILGFAALAAAPLVILVRVRNLIHPNTQDGAARAIASVRTGLAVCYLLALCSIGWVLATLEEFDVLTAVSITFGFFAKILIFNVVISDYFMSLIRFSFTEEEALRGSPLVESLASRMHAVSNMENSR